MKRGQRIYATTKPTMWGEEEDYYDIYQYPNFAPTDPPVIKMLGDVWFRNYAGEPYNKEYR